VRIYKTPLAAAAISAIATASGAEPKGARWSFNNDATDSTGFGHTASLFGSPTFSSGDKKEGSHALSLNGTSQYAQAALTTTATRNVVMAAWVKPNSNSGLQFIVHNGNSGFNGYGMLLDS